MKKQHVVILVAIFICAVLIANLKAIGFFASITVFVITYLIVNRIEFADKINRYRNRFEHIYVVSNHPTSNKELIFNSPLDDLIVCCPYSKVMQEVDNQKKWLVRAGNRFHGDLLIKDEERLQVIPLIFQDGEFINEKWNKGFKVRVEQFIHESRIKRHTILKDADFVWYMAHGNQQDGVNWKKKSS